MISSSGTTRITSNTSSIEKTAVKNNLEYHDRSITFLCFEQEQRVETSDESQKCFLTSWESQVLIIRYMQHEYGTGGRSFDYPSFILSWRKQSMPSRYRWSIDALHVGSEVLGTLTLIIPEVKIHGSCRQMENLLDSHIDYITRSRRR